MTNDETNALRAIIREELAAKLDPAVESIAGEFGQLRAELISRMERLEQQMERSTEQTPHGPNRPHQC